MNLKEEKKHLIDLLKNYLNGNIKLEVLKDFTWEIIEYFSDKNKEFPSWNNYENVFWYAIWQIQHLAEENEEITKESL